MQRDIRNQPKDEMMSQMLGKPNPTCKFGEGYEEERRGKTKVAQYRSSCWVRLDVGLCQLNCPWGEGGRGSSGNQRDSQVVKFIYSCSWKEPRPCPEHLSPQGRAQAWPC